MRVFVTLLLLISCHVALWAQPINDDCSTATVLNLTNAPSCPSTSPVVNNFTATNIDATAISPYPVFGSCPSGSTTGPAAEVWFTFTATANQTTIRVTGLAQPNIVIYQGSNCISLIAINCSSGNGNVNMATTTLIGQQYYILVSGGDIADQANFNLTVTSNNLCGSCAPPGAIDIIPNPPPINGTYSSGSTVQICVNVNTWLGNAAATIEWIHAVTFEFGDSWDESSIVPNPPASCGGDGSWDWYDSWTGCNTNQTFGPGFAYDSSSGLGACGGSPNDGNPGNNWGDGQGGCSNVPAAAPGPFRFCFNITVGDCPPSFTGDDLGIGVQVWSDGDSGSWDQTGCNSGQELDIVSSVVCCNDDDPLVTVFDASCAGIADGSIEMAGNGGFDPSEVFNFYVFNASNNQVFQCINCSDVVTTLANLPAGFYTVTALNVATDCARSTSPFQIGEPDQPQASAVVLNMPCPGSDAMLEGSVDPPGGSEDYTWVGPGGITYNGQSVDVPTAGIYTLTVDVDGCPSTTATVNVQFVNFSAFIIGENEVCFDTPFDLEASAGSSWAWVDTNTGATLGTDQVLNIALTNSTTIELTATDDNGCDAVSTIAINVNDLPIIDIDVIGNGCSNTETILTASGAGPGADYVWTDSPGEENPRFLNNLAPGFYTFEVTGTDVLGCAGTAEIDVEIVPAPNVTLQVSSNPVCAGSMVTVTAVSTEPIAAINWNGAGPNNQNPITITVNSTRTIVADVTSTDGCTTEDVTTTINVQQPPAPPVISCGASTATSTTFNWTAVPGATQYQITINGGAPITVASPGYTATGFVSNTPVTITVQATGAGLCPTAPASFTCNTLACPPITLAIDPVAAICLTGSSPSINLTYTNSSPGGSVTWSGTGITNTSTGVFSPTTAGPGSHTITLTYTQGPCVYTDTETIIVSPTPTANFSISNTGPVCTNSPVTITYTGTAAPGATYNWNFGGGTANPGGTSVGPHTISWATGGTKTITLTVTENGCSSTLATQSVSVVAPIATPMVSCGISTTSSVVFNWAAVTGATSYTVNVSTGQTGVLAGETYTVTGLLPGETVTLTVTANTNNVCGATTSAPVTCTAANCPNFNISITPIAAVCLNGSNAPIALVAAVTGGNATGTLTWSGPGVLGTQFDPTIAGAGMHTITATYTEGACSNMATTQVNVFATPTADFTIAPAPVCIDQNTTLTYTGTGSPAATYTWNFNGGVAVPGTGPGPHTVSWPTGGTKTVTLRVTENMCASAVVSQNITVAPPLAAPVINCSPTTTTIVFSWNAVAGASGYLVNILSAPPGAMGTLDEAARTFTVTGLNATENVEIEVIATNSGPCGNSSNTFTCQAQDCPPIMVTATDLPPLCLTPNSPEINLAVNIVGDNGTGTTTWSGDGIIDPALGTFSPSVAGAGATVVTVRYREGACEYVDDLTIQINPVPSADFTVDSPICLAEATLVNYTGSAAPNATYNWNFGGGTANPGTGAGPHTVTWLSAGDQTISLVVTEAGCASASFTQTVTVNPELVAPIISCEVRTDSIIFTWPEVVGSTGYLVSIVDAPANAFPTGGDPDRTFTLAGFTPGQTATIAVQALSGTACPDITFEGTCALENCPDVTITITEVMPICLDANAVPFGLTAVLTGNTGNTLVWSGPGITDPVAGTFDPNASGAGTFTISVVYEEMGCTYTDDTVIIVNAQPNASFTASGPICVGENSTITYTGGADPGATYDWDFSGGVAVPGTGPGPHTVSWPTGGTPTISLIVTENNCASDPFAVSVEVASPLSLPVINCVSDNTSITFSWNAVTEATGYTVTVINAPVGAVATPDLANRQYSFTNLAPGDEVTIQVNVETNNVCGSVSATQTCTAQACAARSFGTVGYGPFCVDAGLQTLAPTITGGNITGIITWSGAGIQNPATGTFDPAAANLGDNLINLAYAENGCFYDTTYTVVVNPLPVAAITATSPICLTETSTVTFTGTAGAGATYNWDFGNGTVGSGTGAGPYEISWDQAGNQTVGLTVTENGCSSIPATATVVVEDPLPPVVVTCQSSTTSSITFAWAPVTGATGYSVVVLQGPTGVQTGTTYFVDGLAAGQEVIIEVTASGGSICGSSTASGSCLALECQPLTAILTGPDVVCSGGNASLVLTTMGGNGTPFTVDYTVNGAAAQLTGVQNTATINLPNINMATTVVITQLTDESNANCVYQPLAQWTVAVDMPVSAGSDLVLDPVCASVATLINLGDELMGEDSGGSWAETSSSTGGAFQAATGTFNGAGQSPGTYTFVYSVAGGACPASTAEVSLTILADPIADAGLDQTLTCSMGAVTLGGSQTNGTAFAWSSTNPDAMITDPTAALIDVSAPGTYTLEVTNADGCTASDMVVVSSLQDVPVGNVSISEISCFQANDGAIAVNSVAGGTPPYTYQLNNGTPTTSPLFTNLGGAEYILTITDANGCFTEVTFMLLQPNEVSVTLITSLENNGNVINLGESITLQALYDPALMIDTIIWRPDSIAVGNQPAVTVSPSESTTYTVTITDINGCSDSDNLNVIVQKLRPVYMPTAFAPGGNSGNQFLYPQGGSEIQKIKTFQVFNRWGETVFANSNFFPNDPTAGWDGTFRGQPLNAAVFVYFMEVEFIDGETVLFKGDVMLMH